MTENLKTLKDLELHTRDDVYENQEIYFKEEDKDFPFPAMVELEDLKKEAIKWVKFYEEHIILGRPIEHQLFIEFFNITEEDLK